MAWQSMRNGCAKASFNPFLSTFLLFFFHWKPARPDALFCSLGLFLRPSLLALRPCRPGQVAGGGALPRGPAGTGRVPGGGKETAGVLREEVLERLLWCLRCLEATHFYIINGIRGPRMPGRRGSWHSTVPWVR